MSQGSSAIPSLCSPIPHRAVLGKQSSPPARTNRLRRPDRLPCNARTISPRKNHEAHDRNHTTSVLCCHGVARRKRSSTSLPTAPADNDILTVAEVAEMLKCKPSSIYNLTRSRGQARCGNPIPVLRLPMGLRFRRSSLLAWLKSRETSDSEKK